MSMPHDARATALYSKLYIDERGDVTTRESDIATIAAFLMAVEREWIDVNERLPDEGVIVAVFYGAKEVDGVDVGWVRKGTWWVKSLKPDSHCGTWKVLKWCHIPPMPCKEQWSFTC